MRVRVIPDHPLRIRQPVFWAAAAVSAALIVNGAVERLETHLFLNPAFIIGLAALVSFPLADALTHRTYTRVTRRATIFGFSLGFFFVLFLALSSGRDTFLLIRGTVSVRDIVAQVFAPTLLAIILAFAITFVLNRFLGRHTINDGTLCWHCAYSTTGLDAQTRCPECGNEYSEDPPASRARAGARRVLVALASLALALQIAQFAHVLVTETVPHARFRAHIPPYETTANVVFAPPGDRAGVWHADAITCVIDITERARELRVDGTHLSVTWLYRPDLGGVRAQFDVCIASHEDQFAGRSFYSSISHVVWNLHEDDLERFKDTGGLTPERIDELLIAADRERYSTGGLGARGPRGIRTWMPRQRWLFRDTEWPDGGDAP